MGVRVNGNTMGEDCYPNNERILKEIQIFNKDKPIEVQLRYSSDVDITTLIMTKLYLDDEYPEKTKILKMLYVPYSRMDRKIKGYLFSLKYFCKIINSLNFDKVIVMDVHSSMTTGLLNKVTEINPSENILKIMQQEKIDYILYPDAGAMKRYSEALELPIDIKYFCANKKRNLQTGEIIKFELVDCPDIQDKNVLIVDDLCAKGGTFIGSATALKERGAKDIFLYVSHCEYSIFNGNLLNTDLVKKIFTTNSILIDYHKKIQTI